MYPATTDRLSVSRERKAVLNDLNSGEWVEVISPSDFELETVLINSGYFRFGGREYRFLLCRARELGLKIS